MKANTPISYCRQGNTAGTFHGVGIPTQYGVRKGTFTNAPVQGKEPKGTPPTKF